MEQAIANTKLKKFHASHYSLYIYGVRNRSIRVMIVGVPNVGKSTLINRLVGKNKVVAADRPGVTRGQQWVTIAKGLELLDTPGVLWPKFEDPEVGFCRNGCLLYQKAV